MLTKKAMIDEFPSVAAKRNLLELYLFKLHLAHVQDDFGTQG
jgi:hypothetical protein